MQIAVLGASGRTGAHVVTQGLGRGHRIVAVARQLETLEPAPGLQACPADVRDPRALSATLAGVDAVISTVGAGTGRAPTDLYSRGAANVVAAVRPGTALAFVSAAPAGPRAEQGMLERRVMMPILDRLFGGSYEDMRRMEAQLAGSKANWVVARPPRLLGRTPRGTYRIAAEPLGPPRAITHADLASALLDLVEGDTWRRQAVYLAN